MSQTFIELTCGYCGALFTRRLGNYNQRIKQNQKQYCSPSCNKKANPTPERNLEKRFWGKVRKTNTCWIWTGGTTNGGYGVFWYKGKMMRASHIAYMLTFGVLPEKDVELMHDCDNPPCVRPDHLISGTHAENMQDMKRKERGGAGNHVRGETNGSSKLTAKDVMVIRERLSKGEKHSNIAKDFHVARTTITAINQKQNWSYSN